MSSILELILDEPNGQQCLHVNNYNTSWEKCNFTSNSANCKYDGIIYDFTKMVYCDIGDDYRAASVCVLLAVLLFLFLAMGTVADEFLCPSLLTVSKTLRLPDNIAGVTFLAFGNGAPDIFSAISGVTDAKPTLIFSGLFGAGIFVTTVVAGSVLLTGEFEVMQRPLMRDIAFYIGATFMVWFIIWKTHIYLKNAITLVVVYVCYIGVVIIGRYFYMKTKKARKVAEAKKQTKTITKTIIQINDTVAAADDDNDVDTNSTDISVISDSIDDNGGDGSGGAGAGVDPEAGIDFKRTKRLTTKRQRSQSLESEQDVVLTRFYRKGTMRTPRHSRTNSFAKHLAHHHHENMLAAIQRNYDNQYNRKLDTNTTSQSQSLAIPTYESSTSKVTFRSQISTISVASIISMETLSRALTESRELLLHLSPIDLIEWPDYRWYRKLLECVKALPYFVMTLCIPVVDLESPKDNWCRLLTCINIIFAPQVALFFLGYIDDYIIPSFPIWSLTLVLSLIVAAIVYLTSTPESPPRYNRVFGFVGFGVSVIFINAIANEVINVLETLGIMFNLSDAILGLTILAWGNSLGDLISDISMARHGYPGIGISACFGGPLLNLLLGLGIPYTIMLVDEPEDGIELVYNRMVTLLYTTISISLISSLSLFICNRFRAKKFHGIYLISIYFIYVVFAILIESEIL
ncbi:mitochondrial sodium/calcium exchanger protein-like [Oppia nitens]|uniref:mitochondrial sodium/calcium exchanger protein-like n=1 Tax=Oppia nitens TaxID=1686743 RepID=UPI0023DB29BD|nr:mitochondrial sodium/calcium exchanger protein-like [Oppia nitens]